MKINMEISLYVISCTANAPSGPLLNELIGAASMTAGFGSQRETTRTTRYWVSCYEQGNEDEAHMVERITVQYLPGQDKDKQMLKHCYKVFKESPKTWEILVHKGPSEIPASGDDMIARLCREPFEEAEELTV
jgi:hypothetical protein